MSRFLGRHRWRESADVSHRHCWFCARDLGSRFTSVDKNGQRLHVHFACRAAAQARVDGPAPIDYERLPA